MKHIRFFRAIVLCVLVSLLFWTLACSKKEGATSSRSDNFELGGELLKRVPDNSFAFFQWEASHRAYEKLLSSPWSGSGDFFSFAKKSPEGVGKVFAMLSKAGINLEEEATWRKVLSQAVFFVAPPAGGESNPDIGVVFRSEKSFDPSTTISSLKKELQNEGVQVEEYSAEGIQGLTFVPPASQQQQASHGSQKPVAVSIGTKDGLTAVANRAGVLSQVLKAKDSMPPIVTSGQIQRATAGMAGNKSRFAFGFVDLSALLTQSKEVKKSLGAGASADSMSALESVAVSFAMKDVPETDFRLMYDAKDTSSVFSSLSKSKSSAQLFSSVPQNPLLFLSLDGGMLRSVRDAAVAAPGAGAQQMKNDLAFLDDTGRVGLVATLAAPGTSFLPIPNIMLLIESKDAQKVNEQLRGFISTAMARSGMGTASAWTEKQVDGAQTHSMQGTLGVGAHIASKKGLVLLSTSEQQLKQGLQATKGEFVASLAGVAKNVFVEQATIGNFYLDFDQVATFMETMGGVLSMYAPQDQSAAELLKPENIQSLRQMGAMIGSFEQKEGMVGFRTFYQEKSS